ncbi:MAG: quinolinate synthase NadA [Actinobacteria bacterium]|nr:quinolinate synthase NadA [Actinomycetota bacterium]
MLRLQAPLPDRYTLATPEELDKWIAAAKQTLGDGLLILGHHYQRPEVIKWADLRGDSFKLAQFAAENHQATDIVFCGVHFMAEAADILTGDHQRVVLPDLNAGCSMADMADIDQVEEAWDEIAAVTDISRVVPITYMNSSAALKAFVGDHGGAVCTSSNAQAILEWAFERGDKVLFFPDQHLGRNTGYTMGYDESHIQVWNPHRDLGGLDERDVKEAIFLLWKGHCTVHQRFLPEHVAGFRAEHPDGEVIVHPECRHEVAELADRVGSTERIIEWVDAAPPGATIAIGTEIHMIQRLAAEHPDKIVVSLDPLVCPCSTMFRIDGPHLAWCLESLVRSEVVNQIVVDDKTAESAKVALQRMLDIKGAPTAPSKVD